MQPAIHALAAADVLAFLSWHDAFGWVALEAMGCGVPVIGTPYAGSSELIQDGETGLIVDPASADDIARAVRSLLDDGVRQTMGRAAATVAARYDETDYFRAVLDIMTVASDRTAGPHRLSATEGWGSRRSSSRRSNRRPSRARIARGRPLSLKMYVRTSVVC